MYFWFQSCVFFIFFSNLSTKLINHRFECQLLIKLLCQQLLYDFLFLRIFIIKSLNLIMYFLLLSTLIHHDLRHDIQLWSECAVSFFLLSFSLKMLFLLFKKVSLTLDKIYWKRLEWFIVGLKLRLKSIFNRGYLDLFLYFFWSLFNSFMRVFN